jgi:hypothetical protein
MHARFHCTSTEDFGDCRTVRVHGSKLTGHISSGMSLNVDLSGTFGVGIPISMVLESGELLIDCDDQEGVNMVLAFDVSDEILEVI